MCRSRGPPWTVALVEWAGVFAVLATVRGTSKAQIFIAHWEESTTVLAVLAGTKCLQSVTSVVDELGNLGVQVFSPALHQSSSVLSLGISWKVAPS